MTISNNGGNNRSFEGNTSLLLVVGSPIPPTQQVKGGLNTSDLAFNQKTLPVALNSLLAKQLKPFIKEIVQAAFQSSQANGAGQPSQ
ncbi:UNVERIFIED_CONTAM: hypothetical protein Sradi_0926100 [Sesamum radiatum]|uniref:Uncharacterized protein n=1 Tax=Sesamum radiatum TaxID=300843 RepID=A0AAW2V4F9_SESRA